MKTFPIAWEIINLQITQNMVKNFQYVWFFNLLYDDFEVLLLWPFWLRNCALVSKISRSSERKKQKKELRNLGHWWYQFSSFHFSRSVVSDYFQPHEPQQARPPCPSPTPRVHSNPCPLSWWCHPTISSSVVPFSSCPQSFPTSGSFQMSQLSASSGQSIRVSASTSVLPMYTQDWHPLGWTGWISLKSKGLSRVFSNTTVQKHQFFGAQLSL